LCLGTLAPFFFYVTGLGREGVVLYEGGNEGREGEREKRELL
jgi:hypothetical protein